MRLPLVLASMGLLFAAVVAIFLVGGLIGWKVALSYVTIVAVYLGLIFLLALHMKKMGAQYPNIGERHPAPNPPRELQKTQEREEPYGIRGAPNSRRGRYHSRPPNRSSRGPGDHRRGPK